MDRKMVREHAEDDFDRISETIQEFFDAITAKTDLGLWNSTKPS